MTLNGSQLDQERQRVEWERECRKLKGSFYEFVLWAWPIVEPAMALVDNWHVKAICDHLQAVSEGKIRKLLINIPPGHAKSLLVSVLWPAWVWTWRPTWRGVFSSYSDKLVRRDSIRTRMVLQNEDYQRRFVRGKWVFREDQNRADDFVNTMSGRRMTITVGGTATGERGDCVVFDDPINASKAHFQNEREAVKDWWHGTMQSRLNDPRVGCFVGVMQRLHEDDLSGDILATNDPFSRDGYQHLMLPSLFEDERRAVTYYTDEHGKKHEFWRDPRVAEGELLFPQVYTDEVLEDCRKPGHMGEEQFAGQHQQRPAPAEGLLFKKLHWKWFRLESDAFALKRPDGCVPVEELSARELRLEDFELIVFSVDAAFKDLKDSDFVAIGVIGVKGPDKFIIEVINERMDFVTTCATVEMLHAKYNPVAMYVEDKANGTAVINYLQAKLPGFIPVQPMGGKRSRAAAAQPQVQAGNVYLRDGATWAPAFVLQTAGFPKTKHDDMVDMLTQALNELAGSPALALLMGAYG